MTLEFVIESRRRPAGEFKWNDEKVERLKELHKQGLSGSEIAADLGCSSRNAVCGKIDRLRRGNFAADFEARRGPAHAPRSRPRGDHGGGAVKSINAKKERGGQNGLNLNTPRPRIDFAVPVVDADIPATQRRTLLELDGACCHWPIGDPHDPAFFFCGGPAITGFPYCAYHSRVAYLPPNARRGHMRPFKDF